jgi:hypothetical protein
MTLYAIRKRAGQWWVFYSGTLTIGFETYNEALEVALAAAAVLGEGHQLRGGVE